MYIYLAHPIDFVTCEQAPIAVYAEQLRGLLLAHGATAVYTPSMAFDATPPMPPAMQEINMHAISRADAMIAMLPTNVPTIGVPFELGYCYAMKIPTVVVRGATSDDRNKMRETSAMLSWMKSPIYPFDQLEMAAHATLKLAQERLTQ